MIEFLFLVVIIGGTWAIARIHGQHERIERLEDESKAATAPAPERTLLVPESELYQPTYDAELGEWS